MGDAHMHEVVKGLLMDYMYKIYRAESVIVVAKDLIAAGWLIEAGYARAEDDREGPRISLTPAGRNMVGERNLNKRPRAGR